MSSANTRNLLSKQDIFQLEQNVMAKLNNFNQTYATYMRCGATGNSNQTYIDKSNCPTSITQENVDNAKSELDDAIAELNAAIGTPEQAGTNDSTGGKTPASYAMNYNYVTKHYYNNLVKTRKDIDDKLAELYNTSESTSSFYDKMYMSTMYSKIVLTILATSIIYYTIMKLRNK
jgi:hypothetical protein